MVASFIIAAAIGGCAFPKERGGTTGTGAAGRTGSIGLPGAPDGGAPPPPTYPPLDDFPAAPIVESSAPADAQSLFDGTAARGDGAPCLTSPAPATLMPRNWLRPRFDYTAAGGENLFEVTLTVAGFAHPLRVFTAASSYALDGTLWNRLRDLGERPRHHGHRTRPDPRRQRRRDARAVRGGQLQLRDRPRRRPRQDRLLGAQPTTWGRSSAL